MTKITEPGAGEALAQRRTLKDTQKDLERQEEVREIGMSPRQTKTRALDTGPFTRKFPGRKARYVRVDNVESREADGWVRASEADAKAAGIRPTQGSQKVLMWISVAQVEAYHRAQQHRTRSLLEATKGTFKAEVAAAEQELRAQGADVTAGSLLSDESDGRGMDR